MAVLQPGALEVPEIGRLLASPGLLEGLPCPSCHLIAQCVDPACITRTAELRASRHATLCWQRAKWQASELLVPASCGCLFVHVSCTHAADPNGINNSSMFEDRIGGTVVNKDVSRISVALTVAIQNCGLMHKTDSKNAPVPM